MPNVEVVDRGAREIVVFLSGDIDDTSAQALTHAIDEVDALEQLNGLSHAIVDMHGVTSFGEAGVAFLRELEGRGRRVGFDVSFSMMTGPAHRALEAAGWSFVEHSPPSDLSTWPEHHP
jgi:anti-anti-sigma regulatory factor